MKFFYTSLLSLSLLLTLPTFSADTPNNSSVPKKEEKTATSKEKEIRFVDVARYAKKKLWNRYVIVGTGATVIGLVVAPLPTAIVLLGAATCKMDEWHKDPKHLVETVEVIEALKD